MVTIYFLDNRRVTFSSVAAAEKFLKNHRLSERFERFGNSFFQEDRP